MLKRNLWKLIVTAAALVWAAAEIIPLHDVPFTDYVRSHATAKQAELGKLLEEAAARKKNLQAASDFVALKQIGKERKIDLSQFFPDIKLEATLRNVEKRNDIILNELLRRSKRRLPLGLDLAGGVAFTLEAVDGPNDRRPTRTRGRRKSPRRSRSSATASTRSAWPSRSSARWAKRASRCSCRASTPATIPTSLIT